MYIFIYDTEKQKKKNNVKLNIKEERKNDFMQSKRIWIQLTMK